MDRFVQKFLSRGHTESFFCSALEVFCNLIALSKCTLTYLLTCCMGLGGIG